MALHPEPLTLVVRADTGITRVEDLAGRRVWLGLPRAEAPVPSPASS